MLRRRDVIRGGSAMTLAPLLTGAAAPTTLAPKAMQADIALLRRAYATLHPGLYRYQTPAQWDARLTALTGYAAQPRPLDDFYLALSRTLATLRCGHSYVNFYNQTKAVQQALFETPTRLPLSFLWLGDRMIVTADPFATGIAPGSEVETIDGRPAGAILAALMPLARADGGNDSKRRRLLSVQGEDGYESFDLFHAMMFGGRERYRLTVRGPDGRRREAVVPAVTLVQRRRQHIVPDVPDGEPIWTMERRGRAALLTMNSWGLYDSKWDWEAWLDREVARLVADGVPALVVDIRRNEGGRDCGDVLAAHLIDRPLVSDPARRLVRYRELPAELRPYCDTWDRSFDRLGVGARPYDARFLELVGEERGPTVIAPKRPRYRGKVIVLTGPQNSSATFGFAQMMQRERLATIVGEETGGNRRGINGGCFYFLRLPETGLEADLPLIGTFPQTPQPDAGIVPDRPVPLFAAAIARGDDPALAAALRLAAT